LTLGRDGFEDGKHPLGLKQPFGKGIGYQGLCFGAGNGDALANKLSLFRRI